MAPVAPERVRPNKQGCQMGYAKNKRRCGRPVIDAQGTPHTPKRGFYPELSIPKANPWQRLPIPLRHPWSHSRSFSPLSHPEISPLNNRWHSSTLPVTPPLKVLLCLYPTGVSTLASKKSVAKKGIPSTLIRLFFCFALFSPSSMPSSSFFRKIKYY